MKKILAIQIAVLLLASSAMLETVPLKLSYQGRLTDSAGNPLNGTFDIVVRLYDDSTAGNLLLETALPDLLVSNGILLIGGGGGNSGPEIDPSQIYDFGVNSWQSSNRFLEIEVAGEIIRPRTRLLSSPFSILSYGLAGHLFTAPGHLYMIPHNPPVSDCTYVPLEMAVDSTTTRIRMKPYIPVSDCTYVPLELKVDTSVTHMHLHPPNPITPIDSVEPAINMSVDATMAMLELFGIDPGSARSHHRGADIGMAVDAISSSIILRHRWDRSDQPPSLEIGTGIGTGASLVMFNPQPEPPEPWLAMMSSQTGGASLEMFNTEVGPGPVSVPAVQINGGTASIVPHVKVFDGRTGAGGEMNTAEIEMSADGNMGTGLTGHYEPSAGIQPCWKINSGINNASLNLVANHPLGLSKSSGLELEIASSSDSAYVNIIADTNSARIEVFGRAPGVAGSPPAVFVKADNSGGMIGINTVTPTEELHVVGNICATGTIGACSDIRYKKDIETITNAVGLLEKLRGVNFKWRTNEFPAQKYSPEEQVGFVAQELKEVLPELVSQGTDGFYSVDYSRLTPVLVEAVKEQQRELTSLKMELQEMKQLVQTLTSMSVEKKVEVASK